VNSKVNVPPGWSVWSNPSVVTVCAVVVDVFVHVTLSPASTGTRSG
jgi:hypothetical protein